MWPWGKKKKKSATDGNLPANPIMLRPRDCHSHVIPAVDDGSRSMDESIAMLKILQDSEVSHLIATPHIFPARYPNEPEPLARAFDGLLKEAQRRDIKLTLELGAEHYLDDSLVQRIQAKRVIDFGPELYVLFETFTGPEQPAGLFEVVRALRDGGYTPLIAHVERYGYLRGSRGHELFEDLRCAGARFQCNRTVGQANLPGVGPRGETLAWLRSKEWIDEVGSDLHRPTAEGRPEAPPRAA